MPDTPDARTAQALELSDALDIPDMPFQRSAAADLLRALAADVTQLSCDVVELKGRWEMAEAQRDALITAICGYPDHPEMVISTDDALRAAKQWRSDHNADIDRASRLEARLSVALKGLDAVEDLIGDSYGVAGLRLNDDVAPWSDLRQGGHFEDWLRDFDAALDAVCDANRPEIPDSSDAPGAAQEIARNANCPGDPVPCLACKGTGTVPRGPRLCTTCDHGTTGTCAKNHGPATAHKGCSDWDARTEEVATHG